MKTFSARRWARLAGAGSLIVFGLFALVLSATGPSVNAQSRGTAAILDVRGVIAPAMADYIKDGIRDAAGIHEFVILRMDTPGGLDTSMREIIKAILASPVPVATYVSPSGSRAASAGTYILYASHIAAMAPATNLGAATPVQLAGGEPSESDRQPIFPAFSDDKASDDTKTDETETEDKPADSGDAQSTEDDAAAEADKGVEETVDTAQDAQDSEPETEDRAPTSQESSRKKVINDAAAYIRDLAALRGRNAEWAEQAVREGISATSEEAVKLNIIDFVARDVRELLEKADGREVETVSGAKLVLQTKDLTPVEIEKTWVQEFLNIITDPNVALILMQIGILGLIVELYNPGSIFPGVVGIICLLLGLTALSVLPINYGGVALLVVGLVFMIAEFFIISGGILAAFGLLAFIVGALFMFDTDVPGLRPSIWVILASSLAFGGLVIAVIFYGIAAMRRTPVAGAEDLVGKRGKVLEWTGLEGFVWLDGQRWSARSDVPLGEGQEVEAVRLEGLTVWVKPVK